MNYLEAVLILFLKIAMSVDGIRKKDLKRFDFFQVIILETA
jgi:hypothetical protein